MQAEVYQWAVDGPPLGVWRTAEGTFSNVMSAAITFRPDGTASAKHYSAMSGETERSMLWQHLGPGEIRIYEIHPEHPVPESARDWDRFCYRAEHRVFDAGSGPVLVNHGVEDGWLKADGFWQFEAPVSLVERFSDLDE